jgi:hypothetical protein
VAIYEIKPASEDETDIYQAAVRYGDRGRYFGDTRFHEEDKKFREPDGAEKLTLSAKQSGSSLQMPYPGSKVIIN